MSPSEWSLGAAIGVGLFRPLTLPGCQAFHCAPGEGSRFTHQHQGIDLVDGAWCFQSAGVQLGAVTEVEAVDDYGCTLRSRPRGTDVHGDAE